MFVITRGENIIKKTFRITAIVFALLGAAYFYATPYIALANLKEGMEKHDKHAISDVVNFSALRESIKNQMNIEVAAVIEDDNPFAVLGGVLALGLAGAMVDKFVTPEGIIAILSFGKLPELEDNDAEASKESQSPSSDDLPQWDDVDADYRSLNRFVVDINRDVEGDKRSISLVLKRENLFGSWKLVGIDGLFEKE